MNVGSYRGASALTAYEKWQEITSQNIAAGSVPGFKKTEATFVCADGGKSQLSSATGSSEDVRGFMPKISSNISFAQGAINQTGNNLDFAIQGSGFFQIQQPNGQMAYTRNGEFHTTATGALVTKEGYPVMGDGGAINLQSGAGPVTVGNGGTLQQGGQPIGKLAVYNSSDPRNMVALSGGIYGQADPTIPITRVKNPQVVNDSLESSNVSPIGEMVNLITLQRAYEANQKLITTDDNETDKAIQALGNTTS